MKFICFGSGSSGNCYYLESLGTAILIDLGIGIRAFKKHLRDYGLTIPRIAAIVVTHEHTDHVKAVGAVSTEFHIPVYTSPAVHEGMQRNRFMTKKVVGENRRDTALGRSFEVGNFCITPFQVPHDSGDNNGYFISLIRPEASEGLFSSDSGKEPPTFCIITDSGHFTDDMIPYVGRARHLVIEANYDSRMLADGPYPPYLQKRISGGRGHMDNRHTAEALLRHLTTATENIWLCHLSEENNHPEVARKTIQESIDQLPFSPPRLHVLKRKVPSGLFELT